jgi:hypothetical protein
MGLGGWFCFKEKMIFKNWEKDLERWASRKIISFGATKVGLGFGGQVERNNKWGFEGWGGGSNQVWLTKASLVNDVVHILGHIIKVCNLDC